VKQVAEAHGGSVSTSTPPDGEGTVLRLSLPTARAVVSSA
jgi:signal transduction histidine kinase